MLAKALVFEMRPFSKVHSILTSQGFKLVGLGRSVKYRVTMRDSSTELKYLLEIPVDRYLTEQNQAKLGQPYLYGEKRIPLPVMEAAESKLYEIADYLRKRIRRTVDTHQNGSMVQNEDEMKQLGKEMESMETQEKLHEKGLVSDPGQ